METDSRLHRALRAGTSQPGDIERVVQCLRDAGFAISRNPDPNEEVIWATAGTGDDFQCVHADDWRIAQKRIAELEAALREAIEGWEDGANYKGEYLREKHRDSEGIAKARTILIGAINK